MNTLTVSPALRHALFWIAIFAASLFLMRALGQTLLPFVVGAVVAYFLNPVCNGLVSRGMSRALASLLVLIVFALIAVNLIIIIGPLISAQLTSFAQQIPGYIDQIRAEAKPLIDQFLSTASEEDITRARELTSRYAGEAAAFAGQILSRLWQGGTALLNIISLIFITPIVSYYLMRDWPQIITMIDDTLPRAHAPVIRKEIKKVDKTLAGFLRGQASVCMILGIYYAVVLSLLGINFGLVLGLIGGIISFMPYIGSAFVFIAAVTIAIFQFDTLLIPAIAAGAIMVGQFVEGNFLTPKLVGESVGLHPLWVIFALMAGGALFGFVGLVLAVPIAAVIGVLVRFALGRYLESSYYNATSYRQTRRIKPI